MLVVYYLPKFDISLQCCYSWHTSIHNIIKLYQSQNCTGLLHRKLNFGQNILHCVISLLRSYVGKFVEILIRMSIDIIYSFMIMYCNLCYILIVWLRLVLVFLCVVTFCINISISKIPVLIYPMFPMFPNSIM